MDTLGFGNSDSAPGDPSIELWAQGAFALLDALGETRAAVVGHHTGAAIAVEMAAMAPERVSTLVLSACPFVDAARRARHEGTRVIDDVAARADSLHIAELGASRQPFYPTGDIDLLQRLIVDALRAGAMAAEGHRVVNRYRMEDRLGTSDAPHWSLLQQAIHTFIRWLRGLLRRSPAASCASCRGAWCRFRPDAGGVCRPRARFPGRARRQALRRRSRPQRTQTARVTHYFEDDDLRHD